MTIALILAVVAILIVIDRRVAAIELARRNEGREAIDLERLRSCSLVLRGITSAALGAFASYILLTALRQI